MGDLEFDFVLKIESKIWQCPKMTLNLKNYDAWHFSEKFLLSQVLQEVRASQASGLKNRKQMADTPVNEKSYNHGL